MRSEENLRVPTVTVTMPSSSEEKAGVVLNAIVVLNVVVTSHVTYPYDITRCHQKLLPTRGHTPLLDHSIDGRVIGVFTAQKNAFHTESITQ